MAIPPQPEPVKRVAVRMLRAYASNSAGELCSFPAAEAAMLVKKGMAVLHEAKAAEPEPMAAESKAVAAPPVDKMMHAEDSEKKSGGLFRRKQEK